MRTPELNPVQKIIITTGALVTGAGMAVAFIPERTVNAADNTPTPTLTPTKTPIPTMTPIPTPTFDVPRATATSRANEDIASGQETARIQGSATAKANLTATVVARDTSATAVVDTRNFNATATASVLDREERAANRGGFPWGWVALGGFAVFATGVVATAGVIGRGVYQALGPVRRAELIRRIGTAIRTTLRH